MTELERRAEEYATYTNPENEEKSLDWDLYSSLIKFTTEETKLLSEHILELQKDKGNLIDENKEAKKLLKNWMKEFDCKLSFNERAELIVQTKQFLGE